MARGETNKKYRIAGLERVKPHLGLIHLFLIKGALLLKSYALHPTSLCNKMRIHSQKDSIVEKILNNKKQHMDARLR
jgi:hypothetical protein